MGRATGGFDKAEPSFGDGQSIAVAMSYSRARSLIGLFVTAMVVAVGVYLFTSDEMASALEGNPQVRLIAIVALGLIGARSAWSLLRTSGGSGEARIENGTVSYSKGSTRWSEPLSAYRAVRWSQEHVIVKREATDSSSAITYQCIELEHPDPERTILLYRGTEPDIPTRSIFERLAKATKLSAVDAREVTEVVRDADDLDKSIKEQVAEGKLAADPVDEPAPDRIRMETEGEGENHATVLTLPPAMSQKTWRLMQAGAAVIGVIGIVQFSLVVMLFSGLGLAGLEYARKRELQLPRTLRITSTELSYEQPARSSGEFTLPLAEIETLQIVRSAMGKAQGNKAFVDFMDRSFSSEQLMLATDKTERSISGLKDHELRWLERFLKSAIARG